MIYVPVLSLNNKPLMPTTQWRVARWIECGKATPFWSKGIFCVRLNVETDNKKQEIALGIDPGSKKEGFTVKSSKSTYVNIQTDAVDWVMQAMEQRRNARRARRFRNVPCRKPRWNRASLKQSKIPPSTKARWQWKLRIFNFLHKLFSITYVVVEDIKAESKGKRRWDKSFSPLETGKKWFYALIQATNVKLITKQGWETKQLRDALGLKKSKNKLSDDFSAHCVDSWVLANSVFENNNKQPDNTKVICIKSLQFHRRQLHMFQPAKDNKRKAYGSTISLGFKRGSLIKHKKYGVCCVGGTSNNRISLHDKSSGDRLCQNAKIVDCKFLCYNSWVVINN